jgi:hypothetical protein
MKKVEITSPVGLAVTSASVGLMEGEEVGFKVVGEVDSNFTTSYLLEKTALESTYH